VKWRLVARMNRCRSILSKLARRAEWSKAKSSPPLKMRHRPPKRALAEHYRRLFRPQQAKAVTPHQIADTRSRLNRVVRDCGFDRLADLSAPILEKWLTTRQPKVWGCHSKRLSGSLHDLRQLVCSQSPALGNPFVGVSKADPKLDQRRKRRSLTEAS